LQLVRPRAPNLIPPFVQIVRERQRQVPPSSSVSEEQVAWLCPSLSKQKLPSLCSWR
ncbi:hypothetical protein FCV25MIE_05729, partial [Fagus crenata]